MADPVKDCHLYRDHGCAHVDGMLCDFPTCSMNEQYRKGVEAGAEALAKEIDREVLDIILRKAIVRSGKIVDKGRMK